MPRKSQKPKLTKEQQQEMIERGNKKIMDALKKIDLDTLEKVRQIDPKNWPPKK